MLSRCRRPGKVSIGGREVPVIGKRQVSGTAPAGQHLAIQVAADVVLSLQF
jgi:hypothetical protein